MAAARLRKYRLVLRFLASFANGTIQEADVRHPGQSSGAVPEAAVHRRCGMCQQTAHVLRAWLQNVAGGHCHLQRL